MTRLQGFYILWGPSGNSLYGAASWVNLGSLYTPDTTDFVTPYFSLQPVLHDWCNKGRGMCYPVCGMMHIKEPLLLIGKSSPCGGSGFPFSLSEWSFIICLTLYNRKYNVLNASLNKTFPPPPCYTSCGALAGTRNSSMDPWTLYH